MVAFAGYPLTLGNELYGVIALFARKPLANMTIAALEAVANQLALGIERKRAEEALAESNALLRGVLDGSTQVGIVATDGEGLITVFNADFRGRENNQAFWGRKPRFLGDLAISALGSLIVYPARSDSTAMKSTLAISCMFRSISAVSSGFQDPA